MQANSIRSSTRANNSRISFMYSRQILWVSVVFLSLFFVLALFIFAQGKPLNGSKKIFHQAKEAEIEEPELNKKEDIFHPDHLQGLKLERDGHLNKDFRQEVVFGNEHEEIDDIARDKKAAVTKIKDLFRKVDTDHNNYLSEGELVKWIFSKMQEHYKEALLENEANFYKFDPDGDGFITWQEYQILFLKERGYGPEYFKLVEMGEENLKLNEDDEYLMYRDQDRWMQADEDEDNRLSKHEFLAFHHPEHSKALLTQLIEEILHDLDANIDKKLTLMEFVSLHQEDLDDLEGGDNQDEWIKERRDEFENVIDQNKDGIATIEELEAYLDPKNIHNAEGEARHLIGSADDNNDGKLSLREVLDNAEVILGSKLFDYAKKAHDEF